MGLIDVDSGRGYPGEIEKAKKEAMSRKMSKVSTIISPCAPKPKSKRKFTKRKKKDNLGDRRIANKGDLKDIKAKQAPLSRLADHLITSPFDESALLLKPAYPINQRSTTSPSEILDL